MKANIMKHDSQYINLRTGGMLSSRRDCVKGLVGLAGILATGQAPAAFVRSMLGARGMAFGGGKKLPSAKDYVQQDLLVHFNAKENAGYGAYNPSATTWIDLSGNGRSATLTGATEWNDEFGLVIKAFNQNGLATFNGLHNAVHTIEIIYLCFNANGYSRVLAENQWLTCNALGGLVPYYVYGWGKDSTILSGKTQQTCVAQTISVRDNGTKNPEVFKNGVSEGSFAVSRDNLGNAISTLANRSAGGRGFDGGFLAVRIYNRALSDSELEHNAGLDKQLFGTQDEESFNILSNRYTSKIDRNAFKNCTNLKSVGNLEACTIIDNFSFSDCIGLEKVGDLTACTNIVWSSFSGCTSLMSIGDLSACTNIGGYSFSGCTSLMSIGDLSACTNIGRYSFSGCTSLMSIGDLSACTNIGSDSFSGCTSLMSISFSEKTSSQVEAITGFSNLPQRMSCVIHCSDGDFYSNGTNLIRI